MGTPKSVGHRPKGVERVERENPELRAALKKLIALRAEYEGAEGLSAADARAVLAHLWDLKHRVASLQRSQRYLRQRAGKLAARVAEATEAERCTHRAFIGLNELAQSFAKQTARRLKAEDKVEPVEGTP